MQSLLAANSVNQECRLRIVDLYVNACIGCTAKERSRAQTLSIGVEVCFESFVVGIKTDQLSDTCCYSTIVKEICNLACAQKCRLIEYFAGMVHSCVSEVLLKKHMQASSIEVRVKKVYPTMQNLHGGATFIYAAPPLPAVDS